MMVSKYIQENHYAGFHRVMIDGLPQRMRWKPSDHAKLMHMSGDHTKKLKTMEGTRYPETTYSPAPHGIYNTPKGWRIRANGILQGTVFETHSEAKAAFDAIKGKSE